MTRLLFFATVTDAACFHACELPAGKGWLVALSADPVYRATDRQLAQLHDGGMRLVSWGNQAQIGTERIRAYRETIGGVGCVYQAESAAEFEALPWGPHSVVGSPDAWTAVQRQNFRGHLFPELYTDSQAKDPATYSSMGVPVTSPVFGVALDGGVHVPLDWYVARCVGANAWFAGCYSVWHAAGLDDDDWRTLLRA